MSAVPAGERERRAEIHRVLNDIVDPCSVACGVPIGLVDMGIVESVQVQEATVYVRMLPTYPGCIYTAVFAGEIVERLCGLDWCDDVEVEVVAAGTSLWDEDRMSPTARQRLQRSREERRRRLQVLRG